MGYGVAGAGAWDYADYYFLPVLAAVYHSRDYSWIGKRVKWTLIERFIHKDGMYRMKVFIWMSELSSDALVHAYSS